MGGLSTAFSLGSLHKLESGAIVQETAALHVSLAHGDVPGVSTEIAALRRLLTQSIKGKLAESFQKVSKVTECEVYSVRGYRLKSAHLL